MRTALAPIALTMLLVAVPGPAQACLAFVPMTMSDVRYADVVVLGRVTKYEIVPDVAARDRRAKMLAASPQMSEAVRNPLAQQTSFLGDFARFEISVDQVLSGTAEKAITVTWQNSTFMLPDKLSSEQMLICTPFPEFEWSGTARTKRYNRAQPRAKYTDSFTSPLLTGGSARNEGSKGRSRPPGSGREALNSMVASPQI